MKMHEMMQDYVKKERNKPLARSISAEMLEHTKAVVKKHTLGKGSYKYHLAQPARMLARAFQLWRKVILRKLKKKTSSRYPWTVRFSWNFPMEMFACLGVLCGHEPHTKIGKNTRNVKVICVETEENFIQVFNEMFNKYQGTSYDHEILTKREKDGSICKLIVNLHCPVLFSYSKKLEVLKYGRFNKYGVPQHTLPY